MGTYRKTCNRCTVGPDGGIHTRHTTSFQGGRTVVADARAEAVPVLDLRVPVSVVSALAECLVALELSDDSHPKFLVAPRALAVDNLVA